MKHNKKNTSPFASDKRKEASYIKHPRCAAALVLALSLIALGACSVQPQDISYTAQTTETATNNTLTPSEDEGSLPDSSAEELSSALEEPSPAEEPSDNGDPSETEEPSETESSHQHEYGEYVTVTEPDCTTPGKALAACQCGETIAEEIPALGHEYVVSHQKGLTVYYKCKRCGDEISETKTLKAHKDINDLSIYVEAKHIYDGKLFKPTVIISDGDEDVTGFARIEYDDNAVGVGAYFLKITMNGCYTGTRNYEYKIFPETPKLTMPDEGDDGCTVAWNNCAGADGYLLEYGAQKDFSDAQSVTLKRNERTYKLDGLDKEVPCYIRIRSFADVRVSGSNVRYRSSISNELQYGRPHIETINGITYVDGILIANKTYSLPSDYDPGFDPETQRAFDKMAADAAQDGIYLYIVSGYRSYSTQYSTYNYFVYDRGTYEADRCSARPGHSEHQTGLACDINTTSSDFEGTPEAIWIDKNCWKYGFIVRYPKGKEDITGYKYEPWHVRYLGKDIAKKVYDSGLTLEEYLGITSVYQ